MKLDFDNPVVPFAASFCFSALSCQILDQVVVPYYRDSNWVTMDKMESLVIGGIMGLGVVGTAAATFIRNNNAGKSIRASLAAAFLTSTAFAMGSYGGLLTSNAITRVTHGYNWEDDNFHPTRSDQSSLSVISYRRVPA